MYLLALAGEDRPRADIILACRRPATWGCTITITDTLPIMDPRLDPDQSRPKKTQTSNPLEKGTVMLVYPLPGARTYASKSAYRCAEEIELSMMTIEPLRKCGWTSLSVGSARGAQTERVSPDYSYMRVPCEKQSKELTVE